ncbi:hypothetical protein KQI65_00005 [bacterium]|nr:hypothetical protein [bacterium]
MRSVLPLLLLSLVLVACNEAPPDVVSSGNALMADMQYYPVEAGSAWEYRVDTMRNGSWAKGVAQVRSSITGTRAVDSLSYAVQLNQVITAMGPTTDTLFVRKTAAGVMMSSPGLIQLASIGSIPGLPIEDIPSEFLAVPSVDNPQTEWTIFNFEYSPIPLLTIRYRISGRYRGRTSVVTDQRTYKDCAHVTLSIDASIPNPDNILVPITIDEDADFYYTRAHGIVVIEGSTAIFTLLRGGLPLDLTYGQARQELINFDIPQPDPFCP